ncbi:Calmodulin [Taenia crassiceps]|uniref:Calmodulin n=1 Tax=Taenia crassiceps TaxID=6207 RepID=A0ABR4Q9K6_9CEST
MEPNDTHDPKGIQEPLTLFRLRPFVEADDDAIPILNRPQQMPSLLATKAFASVRRRKSGRTRRVAVYRLAPPRLASHRTIPFAHTHTRHLSGDFPASNMTAIHWNRFSGRTGHRSRSAAAMDIASLSSFLASSESNYDRASPRSSITTGTSGTKVASTFVEKTRNPMEDGEHLALQLIKAQKLTSDQVSEIRRSFHYFDKNGDGSISLEELTAAFGTIGRAHDRTLIGNLFKEADENGDGVIDYKEFVALMAVSFQGQNQAGSNLSSRNDMYQEAFSKFDVNNDGVIDSNDLKELMKNIGKQLNDKEILEMILEADRNGDGVVDYDEFVHIFESGVELSSAT